MMRNVIYDRFIILKWTLYSILSSRRWGFVNTHVFAVIYSLTQSSLSVSLCWAHFDFIKMWCVFAFLGLSLFFSLKSRMQITGIIPKFAGFEIPSQPFQMQPFSREREANFRTEISSSFFSQFGTKTFSHVVAQNVLI